MIAKLDVTRSSLLSALFQMPPQTPPSPANKPRIRRARVACEYCHGRKVRCDAMVHGFPCTNCRLDNVECLKWASNPKSERRPTEGKKRSRAIYGSESEYNEAQVEPCMPAPSIEN